MFGDINTAGETHRFQSPLTGDRYFLWRTADAGPNLRLLDVDRQIDFPSGVPFSMPAGNVQLEIGGTDTTGHYDLQLQRISDAVLLTPDNNEMVSMSAGVQAHFLRVAAAVGERFSLHADNLVGGGTAQWTVYGPTGAELATMSLDSDLMFVAEQAGEFVILIADEAGSLEKSFELQLTDLTDPPLDRTPTGEILTGEVAGSATETLTFDFRAGDVIELDRLGDSPFSYQWRSPDDTFLIGGVNETGPARPASVGPIQAGYSELFDRHRDL